MPPMAGALHAQRPAGVPDRVELDGTPFFPQTEFACGPAALATVLGAAGVPANPQTLGAEVFLPARKGALQTEMLAGARRHGAVAVLLPPSLEALVREIAAGTPVVVLQNLGLSFAPLWHYAVAVGFDLDAEELLLRSGTTRREAISLRTFEHTWARGGHWAFVAVTPGQLPTSAREQEVVDALVGFERIAEPVAAARAFEGALDRWPANLALAIGLGNSLFAAGRLQPAEAAFAAAAQRHDSAAAWNNLARTRLALGRAEAAREAALHAVARAESAEPQWLQAARETLAATAPSLH
jgi:tetratricopeptide (TPR) repeat protein